MSNVVVTDREIGGVLAAALVLAVLIAGCGPGDGVSGTGAQGTTTPAAPGPAGDSHRWSEYAPADECEFTPDELPSGSDPGEARPAPEPFAVDNFTAWGEGHDQVAIGRGREVLDDRQEFPRENFPSHQVVVKDGVERYAVCGTGW